MNYYNISDTDIREFLDLIPPESIGDAELFFGVLQKLMYKKRKWSAINIKYINGLVDEGMGYAIYNLFHTKANHDLYDKLFPTVYQPPLLVSQFSKLLVDLKAAGIETFADLENLDPLNLDSLNL